MVEIYTDVEEQHFGVDGVNPYPVVGGTSVSLGPKIDDPTLGDPSRIISGGAALPVAQPQTTTVQTVKPVSPLPFMPATSGSSGDGAPSVPPVDGSKAAVVVLVGFLAVVAVAGAVLHSSTK